MSRRVMALVMALSIALSGCANSKRINGVTYDSYGLLNQTDMRNPKLAYRTVWGNVFWGVVLVETVIAPVYFFGFSLFEPVGLAAEFEPGQTR